MMEDREVTLSIQQAVLLSFLVGMLATGLIVSLVYDLGSPTGAFALGKNVDRGQGENMDQSAAGMSDPERNRVQNSGTNKTQTENSIPPENNDNTDTTIRTDVGVNVSAFETQDDPILGSKNASMTLIYWSGFRCGRCKAFENNILPHLIEEFVKTGKLRIVFKSYPYELNQTLGAVVSRCVLQQSTVTQWLKTRQLFFDIHKEEKMEVQRADQERLITALSNANISVRSSEIRTCIAEHQAAYRNEVQRDYRDGEQIELLGRPAFVYYRTGADSGHKIIGNRPYRAFRRIIFEE